MLQQMGGLTAGEQQWQLRHEADVGELCGCDAMAARAPGPARVEMGDGAELSTGEPCASRIAGEPRREADTDRPVVITGELCRRWSSDMAKPTHQ